MPLKEPSECGLACDFSHDFGINDSVLVQQFYTTAGCCIRGIAIGVGDDMIERAANSMNLAPLCLALTRHGNRGQLGEVMFYLGKALDARGVLTDAELGKSVTQYLKPREQIKNHRRDNLEVLIADKVVKFWLGLYTGNKFPLLRKVVDILLVSSTRDCYLKNIVNENFSANSYNINVVVGAVKALRYYFGHQGVSKSSLMHYGKTTGCKEVISKYTRLVDPLMTSP